MKLNSIAKPGGLLDAENVCGADAMRFWGGASDLDSSPENMNLHLSCEGIRYE
jgi:hypothetical protein